ncbi:hypothetical protein C0J52_21037 [Blattella germanica]|nr:hypothetical protein C0J52_21037 [Blattella germanica]
MEVEEIVQHIFGRDFDTTRLCDIDPTSSAPPSKKSKCLENVHLWVEKVMHEMDAPEDKQAWPVDTREGRIGPAGVRFDISSHIGLFVIGADRLSVNSQSNFSTIRANACIFKGKWQYEVQLGSKGVMQIGWATSDCKFSQETGVGDTVHSFAYDGNRVRKWNVSTYKYGEAWLSGDIIGCTIDLDKGALEFYRNGRSMGEAFDNIQLGPNMAYFPAVSLAFTENLVANFGSTPLRYPVQDFEPIQEAPFHDVAKAEKLCTWLSQLLMLFDRKYEILGQDGTQSEERITNQALLMGLARNFFHPLGPLLLSSYITEACLVPFLERLCNLSTTGRPKNKTPAGKKRRLMLHVSFVLDYPHQKQSLMLLTYIVQHPRTRQHLLENVLFDKVSDINECFQTLPLLQTPLPITLCCFHRLLVTFRALWEREVGEYPIVIPARTFYDGSINYYNIDRLGGVHTHLNKILKPELVKVLGNDHPVITHIDSSTSQNQDIGTEAAAFISGPSVSVGAEFSDGRANLVIPVLARMLTQQQQSSGPMLVERLTGPRRSEEKTKGGAVESAASLIELLDGLVLFYHVAAHKQLAKIKFELERTCEVFEQKLNEQSRHMAWVRAAVYSTDKQSHLAWLLRVILQTVKLASQEGQLFAYVPDFYLDSLVEICAALRTYVHPTAPLENIEGNVHRMKMVRALLRPYENRAWAQSNWVLVRIWQGCGFAFRYHKSPHLLRKLGPKVLQADSSLISQSIKPCPSLLFQGHVKEVMINDESLTTAFLNSLLNQLNWAFSEFIGMLQEIQNVSSRPERVFIESRQLKICATCFDLALALLRVLEMVASIAPEIFTDTTRSSSELLLGRLCQLLCQVLNRVSSQAGCFQYVVTLEIPDLETVDHFPILAAVVGILLALLQEELVEHDVNISKVPKVARALLTEPSFQLDSLHFVLGDIQKGPKVQKMKTFSFYNYTDDVSVAEIEEIKKMIRMLTFYQGMLSEVKILSDDEVCTICYAYPISATFKPCNHQSCR